MNMGFIEERLPATGEKLPPDWTLQDPQDYLAVLEQAIPAVLRQAGASAFDVIGVGVDFTASTVLPVTKDGTPLCLSAWFPNPASMPGSRRGNTMLPSRRPTSLNEIAA